MKVAFDRGLAILVRHRVLAVIASVAFVGGMGAFATRLGVDNSLEVWFVEDDPTLVSYRSFLEQFGNDEVVVTTIHGSADAFEPARLERLWHLSRELEAIDGVARVRSLGNQTSVQGSVIGPAVVPVVAPPVEEDDVARARDLIDRRDLAADLVGQDGRTLVIYSWLDVTPDIDTERSRVIDEIRAATEAQLAGDEHASHGGVGVMHEALNEVTLSDGARFVGLSYVVVALVLYLVTRRIAWTLIALVAVAFADLALFGAMALAGRSINMITIALPPLVMILGVANVVHMSTDVDLSIAREARGIRELTRCLAKIAKPCLFNTITTAVAFLSLGTASMAVTRDYGIFAAVGVVLAFVFSLVGMAAVLPRAASFRPPAPVGRCVGSAVERLMLLSVRFRVPVTILTGVIAAGALYGAGRIVVDTYSFEFLPDDHRARVDAGAIEKSAGPFFPLEMTLRTAEPGAWRQVGFFEDLAALQAELEAIPEIGRTTTAGDVLRDVHVAVTGEQLERPWRPEYDEDIENLTELLERTGHEGALESWVAKDDRTLRLTAATPMASAREFMELAERAKAVAERAMGDDVEVAMGGYLPLYSQIVMHTLDDQITSFTLAFLLVFVIVTVVLGSWRYAVVAMPPNLLPVALVLGVMGFAGIRLDLATVTVAAVIMGVIVDDSVHVLYGLRRELAKGRSFEEAIAGVARASGVAVVSTSLVFVAGFLVIAFAGSDAVANPGMLTAVAVVAALVTDLMLLPAFASFLLVRRPGTGLGTGVVLHPARADRPDRVGGKAAALARLGAAGFPVPAWVVVAREAFDVSVPAAQRAALANANGKAGGHPLDGVSLAPAVEDALMSALRGIAGAGSMFAVRSSAVDEDSREHSFAGQLESYLFVPLEDVPRRVTDVWRSAFSERVRAYRRERGLLVPPLAPAVLVQRMVDADTSGVAFSADPVTGDRGTAVIGSLYGLGTALVSGEAEADTHHVDRRGRVVERRVASKKRADRFSSDRDEGVRAFDVDAERVHRPALRDEQIVAVADLARRAESFFGQPQDIEWAITSGQVFLLQSRPITSLAATAAPDGKLAIWDNSNIVESYPGVTTPLTFTFARNAYEGVYRQLCRILGVPAKRVEANRDALANMIGLVRGRIYYNLVHWYRLLATLPGYRMNRAFLEQMLGVKERAPDGVAGDGEAVSSWVRVVDGANVVRSLTGMAFSFFALPAKTKEFHRRVDETLGERNGDPSALSADQLAAEYRRIEDRLITHWEAPQINDFFAMIFYGVLRRLCVRWCGDSDGTLQNGLLCGSGGMVSTEPAERVKEMAAVARRNPELADALVRADAQSLEVIARHAEFRDAYESYMEKFGDRCANELKLESRTLQEDPSMLLRSIGCLARSPAAGGEGAKPRGSADVAARQDAERHVRAVLAGNPVRRRVFGWILGRTRELVRGRENMRLQRTRVFGRVRALFVELGRRFHELGLLEGPRDIFYLEMDEILGFVDGSSVSTDLAGIAAVRRNECARWAEAEPPADRFETYGLVNHGNSFRSGPERIEPNGDERTGVGCCPGRVSGRVRIVRDPADARLRQGEILVAECTDPSWVMLFPLAKGLLVERGSLLSHSAIVARELGIPAIVSIEGVTRWLEDGDRVEFDGATGRLRKLELSEVPR